MDEKEREIFKLEKKMKELEDKYSALSNEFETLLNIIPGMLYCKDRNDIVTRINTNFSKYLNLPKKEIIGKSTFDLFPIEQAQVFRKDDLEVIKSGKPKLNIEEYADFPNGRIWAITNKVPIINNRGEVQGIIGLSIDITERKEIEERFKESEEKYRVLFEQAPDSIYLVDPETQALIEFNYKAYENLGYTKKEFKKLKVSDIEYYDSPEEILTRMKKLINLGGSQNFETKHKTKNGELRDMYVSIKVISIQGRKYCQIICKDITHLKQIEKELRKSEEKYREAFYLANFYRDLLTHDMSNILQSIISSIEFYNSFQDNSIMIDEIGNIAKVIRFHTRRATKLISNIRILTSLQEDHIQLSEVEIFESINKAIETVKNSFPNKNIRIEVEGLSRDQKIIANELLIEIFDNILNNAVIHNDNTDIIKIKIIITKITESNINFLKLEFRDNGRGIPNDRKEKLFQRNYNFDSSKRGMGLGLSLVNQIVHIFGGKIWIEDRVKDDYTKGSNFIIVLKET